MRKKTLLGVFLGLLMSANSYSCDIDGKTGIVEDNPLWITSDQKSLNGITEETFNEILDKVEDLYSPIIEEFATDVAETGKVEQLTLTPAK